jgi:hypothetical protein
MAKFTDEQLDRLIALEDAKRKADRIVSRFMQAFWNAADEVDPHRGSTTLAAMMANRRRICQQLKEQDDE